MPATTHQDGRLEKMFENNNHEPELLAVLMCILISCAGGVARELANFETSFNVKRFISTLATASFSGMIIGLFLPDFEHKNWILALSGMSGVVGVSILDYFAIIFKAIVQHLASSAIGQQIEIKDKDTKNK